MSANAFAISRRLTEKGVEQHIAEAVAEEICEHSNQNAATKADIANLRTDIVRLETKQNICIGIVLALAVAILAGKF